MNKYHAQKGLRHSSHIKCLDTHWALCRGKTSLIIISNSSPGDRDSAARRRRAPHHTTPTHSPRPTGESHPPACLALAGTFQLSQCCALTPAGTNGAQQQDLCASGRRGSHQKLVIAGLLLCQNCWGPAAGSVTHQQQEER